MFICVRVYLIMVRFLHQLLWITLTRALEMGLGLPISIISGSVPCIQPQRTMSLFPKPWICIFGNRGFKKKATMNLPKSMNFFDCRGYESGEASFDGLLATSRQPSLQLIFNYLFLWLIWAYIWALIWAYIWALFLLLPSLSCHLLLVQFANIFMPPHHSLFPYHKKRTKEKKRKISFFY
jgi:hypothetical protein